MRRTSWLVLGISSAGLLILSLPERVFVQGPDAAPPYNDEHRRLLDSLGPARPVEARVSGEKTYRPYGSVPIIQSFKQAGGAPSNTRGSSSLEVEAPSGSPVPREVSIAISRVHRREPSPENRAALAVLNLVQGYPDAAVGLLRQAHALKPEDPRLLNDLAAALLALHEATGDPWQALEAIEVAKDSARLQLTPEALFNEALALEELGLPARALEAWKRYLDQDDRSAWAQEAAQRRDRLEREVREVQAASKLFVTPDVDFVRIDGNPWAGRHLGERQLLTLWGELTLKGRPAGAEAALDEAEVLAGTLTAGGGRLLAASVAAIHEAEQGRDRARIERLARGHRDFGRALSLAREEKTEEARPLLESAIDDLQAARSPFELRARVLRAWTAEEPDWPELQDIELAAEEGGFPSIAAEAQRITAFRISLEGRLDAAVEAYRDARRRFEELGEWEESAVVAAMVAELLGLLGEWKSTEDLTTGLAIAPRVADPLNRYSLYVVMASGVAGRFSRAAVELRLEAAEACRDLPERPLCAVDSWLRVAAITQDAAIAHDALRQAGELVLAVQDSEGKARSEIDLTTSRSRWLASDDSSTADWEAAAELFNGVITDYEAKGRAVSAARARAARARILRKLGLLEDAVAEYRAGLRLFRRWDESDRFRPERTEKRSPRELREVYEELLGIELDAADSGPSPAAFLLSEEMRDRLAPRRSAELWLPDRRDVDRFASEVPPGTAIVEYAFTGERSVAWILAGGHLDQVLLSPQDELNERIHSLVRERDLETWKRTSGTLFQDLVAPILERLPAGTERLILVPDSELYNVPFRALWDPASGRYLDEIFTISFSPSVRQVLGAGENRGAPSLSQRLPLLSLGFTTFHPSLGLLPLPLAAGEAAAVRNVHGAAVEGGCPVTDWASFRKCAPRAEVLHLATHASANSLRSEWTWLAFERETVNLDRLWRELPGLPLRPLVVLSACQSVASAGGGEGLGGLARPFLASGARAIVGTLWKLEDEDAAFLLPEFHREYRESRDAPMALRKARERLESWAERPWMWGGVEVLSSGL